MSQLPDGPTQIDAAPDGQNAAVTLTVTRGGVPTPDVIVVFQNADSSLVARGVTNAEGVASQRMNAGGFVTAINPHPNQNTGFQEDELYTFSAVQPGDALRLDRPESNTVLSFTVQVPIDPTASFYQLTTNCGSQDITGGSGSGSGSGSGGSPGGLVTLFGCGPTVDLVIETFDGNFGSLNALVRQNLAISDGDTVDLTQNTYAPMSAATFDFTNIPGEFTAVNVESLLMTANGRISEQYGSSDVVAGAASVMIRRPSIPGALALTASQYFNGSPGRHGIIEWGAPAASNALDLQGLLLEEYATFPNYDTASHSYTWTTAAGARADFLVADSGIRRFDGKSSTFWTWHLAAPYTGASVAYPVLAGDDATFNPTAEDSVYIDGLMTAKTAGGYDAVRAHILSDDSSGIITGTSGRLVTESLAFGKARVKPDAARRTLLKMLPGKSIRARR